MLAANRRWARGRGSAGIETEFLCLLVYRDGDVRADEIVDDEHGQTSEHADEEQTATDDENLSKHLWAQN